MKGLRKTTNKSVRIGAVSTEIRTQHLPNTSIGHYRYANLLGADILQVVILDLASGGGEMKTI
jgi:hypothetical protein